MKIVRSARLAYREGASDKVYEVDLVENDGLSADARFLVNYRYGRRGSALREGTRTADPIPLERAERVFDSIVVSKVNEGYRRTDQSAAEGKPADIGDEPAAEGREAVLLARLDASRHGPWGATNIDRLLWRIGEVRLRAAAPALREMAARRPAEASYLLVFALARCAGAEGAPALTAIAGSGASQLVREFARFALVCPLMGPARESAGLDPTLPESLTRAAEARDPDRIAGAVAELAGDEPLKVGPALVSLGRAAQDEAGLKRAVAAALVRMPARPPYLIGLRKLYKYAELADDAVLFAATAHRFETAEPMYKRPGWRGETYIRELKTTVPLDAVRGQPNTPVGLSGATLAYFKRRIWRTLRKRSELQDPSFAELASAYLLALRPGDLSKPVTWTRFRYQPGGTWAREPCAMGPLAKNWTASQLLQRNDPRAKARYGSLSFIETPGPPSGERTEAFPELWSRRPDLALRLAAESACEPVAQLGIGVLKADPAFLAGIASADLGRLLSSPHAAVLQLGFGEVRERLARGAGDDDLLAALIGSGLPEARRLVSERIERDPARPWSSPGLAFAALTAAHADLAEPILRWAQERPLAPGLAAPLARSIADWLVAMPAHPEAEAADTIRAARARMRLLWPNRDMPLDGEAVRRLMEHPAPTVAAAGIDVLALTGTDPASLGDETWRRLLGAPDEEVQEAALALFGGLDDAALSGHAALVVAFATAPASRLRQAARPLLARIAARDPALAGPLARELIDSLFAAAPDEAYPDDIVTLLREAFPHQLAALDAGMLWRLLQARAKGAQLLGARLLDERPHEMLSVRQTARLGNHAHLSVRQWAMAAYDAAPARFQAEAADSVLLVESQWPETHEFARAHFESWPADAWTPEALAIVTDSVKPEVLAFARQLLRSRLSPEDGQAQLTRLLEHPAQAMHLLVTEMLTQEAATSEAAFERLLPLARIVMLQVAKGRVAKDRMAAFLKAEALRDPERARRIAPLLSDLTLSGLERDRAQAVLALRDIERTHPGIASPLTRVPVVERAAR